MGEGSAMISPAVQLPEPIAIADVTSHGDRFRCPPYNVVLFAGACAKRQAIMRADPARQGFSQCPGCPHGAMVEQQTGGPLTVAASERRWVTGFFGERRQLAPAGASKPLPPTAPPPAAPAPKENTMAKCIREGCDTEVLRAGGACPKHKQEVRMTYQRAWRERRKAEAGGKAAPARGRPKVPRKAPTRAQVVTPAAHPTTLAQELVEARELITLIGWDLARTLARAVSGRSL